MASATQALVQQFQEEMAREATQLGSTQETGSWELQFLKTSMEQLTEMLKGVIGANEQAMHKMADEYEEKLKAVGAERGRPMAEKRRSLLDPRDVKPTPFPGGTMTVAAFDDLKDKLIEWVSCQGLDYQTLMTWAEKEKKEIPPMETKTS